MGGASETNALSPEQALESASPDRTPTGPGVTVEERAEPFYACCTMRTLKEGEIEGMLSV